MFQFLLSWNNEETRKNDQNSDEGVNEAMETKVVAPQKKMGRKTFKDLKKLKATYRGW